MGKKKRKDDPRGAALVSVADYERAARRKLSRQAYDYYRGGSDAERAVRRNERAYERYVTWYRVLTDVAEIDLRTTVLGTPIAAPLLIAPTAYHKLAHPDGELATAQAAADAGVVYVMSTLATTRLEDVGAATSAPKWFQLYVHKDRGLTSSLVERAETAGFDAIVLTADTPVLGRRLRDERNGFALPDGMAMENLSPADASELQGSALLHHVARNHDASFTFADLEWLRSLSHLPLVIKGVVRADDAARCVDHGAHAIVVSNHGGRQLGTAPATLDALPGVVDAVKGRAEVYLDGGVRWGTDVLTALGLGARAVLLGRPILWGLAVDGAAGVVSILDFFKRDLARAMALAGCGSLDAIERGMISRAT